MEVTHQPPFELIYLSGASELESGGTQVDSLQCTYSVYRCIYMYMIYNVHMAKDHLPLTALPLDRSVVSRAPRVITNSCALDFAKILLQIGCCAYQPISIKIS